MNRRGAVIRCVMLAAASLLAAGCDKNEQGGAAAGEELTLEQKIAQVQSDPNVPEPAKAGAIQALRQQQQQAVARGQSSASAAQAAGAQAQGQAPK